MIEAKEAAQNAAKERNYLIFTDDLRAFNVFAYNELNAINLNHIRTDQWLGEYKGSV